MLLFFIRARLVGVPQCDDVSMVARVLSSAAGTARTKGMRPTSARNLAENIITKGSFDDVSAQIEF